MIEDVLMQQKEFFGAYFFSLAVLVYFILSLKSDKKQLKKSNEKLLEEYKEMGNKAIEVMTLATKSIELSKDADDKLVSRIDNLVESVSKNSCNYEKQQR